MTGNKYIVQPVQKALEVLLILSEGSTGLSLKEICYKSKLPKTTVFRYLSTLVEMGFISFSPESNIYRLGLRSWQLGQAAKNYSQLTGLVLPAMKKLRDQFNETINLGVIEKDGVYYLSIVESSHALRMQARLGACDPVYSTALGKAILAFYPIEQWKNHIPERLTARTEQTITSLEDLKKDLEKTRSRGYSLDQGENEEGACCIAAPIFDPYQLPIAAVSLSAPSTRMKPDKIADISACLRQITTELSQELGQKVYKVEKVSTIIE
jgi:DNA-binding IclR family transcriptional regulator